MSRITPARIERVGRRAAEDRRTVFVDEARARAGVEPAAGDDRDAHQVERVVHAPEPDVRPVAEGERAPSRGPAGSPSPTSRARSTTPTSAGRIACSGTLARARGGAGAREQLPPALEPAAVVDRGVRAPRGVLGDVVRHLLLGGDRDLRQVVEAADVARLETEAVELAPVEGNAFVGEAHGQRQLRALNGAELVGGGQVERGGPGGLAVRALRITLKLDDGVEPLLANRFQRA